MTQAINLTGQIFNRLTVVRRATNIEDGNTSWVCKCVCTNVVVVRGYSLRRGITKSCGCLSAETAVNWNKALSGTSQIDMSGKIFGRLTVIERCGPPQKHMSQAYKRTAWWLCKCSCVLQTIKPLTGRHLRAGEVKSCGCLKRHLPLKADVG